MRLNVCVCVCVCALAPGWLPDLGWLMMAGQTAEKVRTYPTNETKNGRTSKAIGEQQVFGKQTL